MNDSPDIPIEMEDESAILTNQDETDPGEVDLDDDMMGAGPTDRLSAAEPNDFARGEVDVKAQMDRAARAIDYPNRAIPPHKI